MTAPTKAEARRAVTELVGAVAACLAALLAIDRYADPALSPDTRRRLTVGFFGALLALAFLLLGPRRRAVAAVVGWMYDEAPPHTARAARRLAHAADQLASAGVYLAGGLAAATAVPVLALWYPALDALAGPAGWAWWGCAAGVVLLPVTGGFLFQGVYQQYLELRERDRLAVGYRPRGWADLFTPGDDAAPAALAVHDGLRFTAGGLGWGWHELRAGCVVLGQPGSGKTSCVLNAMLEGLLGSAHRAGVAPGGLVLDPKGDFEDKLRALAARYGWADRLRVIDPAGAVAGGERWNPLDSPDDHLELAGRFVAVMETVGQKSGDGTFWIDTARTFVGHAIVLLRATGGGEPPALADIARLATSAAALADRADRLTPRTDAEVAALAYFADEWAALVPETRTAVVAHLTNMLGPFTIDPYRTLFSGRSTVRPADALRDGHLIYLRMPTAEKEVMARTVGTFLKLEVFREVLRARDKARPSLFLCDEFQVFMSAGQGKVDAEFFEKSRQSNHVNLVATLSIPALTRAAPTNKEPAMSLLGTCTTKVFLRNTDPETNKYASDLFGQEIVTVGGRGAGGAAGWFRFLAVNVSAQDQTDPVLRPERFTELAIPVPPGVTHCEAIVHAAGGAAPVSRRRTRWPLHPIV